jgi:preprotein translocase subunit SecG
MVDPAIKVLFGIGLIILHAQEGPRIVFVFSGEAGNLSGEAGFSKTLRKSGK